MGVAIHLSKTDIGLNFSFGIKSNGDEEPSVTQGFNFFYCLQSNAQFLYPLVTCL
eukprot:m.30438 g.30438  ORF g.30438 m.30438 type:complete len:55 (+) comp31343_c0_seq1:752-916(+)